MEGLRIFLKVVICIILVPLILAFSIVVQTKDVVENQFVVEAVKQILEEEVKDANWTNSTVDELTNTKGADELIETLISDYSKYKEDNTYEVGDETAELIISYCLENEETLEKLAEEEFDFDELKTPEAKEEIKNSINEAFKDLNEDGNEDLGMLVYVYAQITSQENLIKVACVIAGLIGLIILLSWSAYKWMTAVGVVGLITGCITIVTYVGINALAKVLQADLGIKLNVNILLIIGAVEFILGLAFVITRSVIDGNVKKSKIENENSPFVEDAVKPEPEITAGSEENDEN